MEKGEIREGTVCFLIGYRGMHMLQFRNSFVYCCFEVKAEHRDARSLRKYGRKRTGKYGILNP